MSVHPIRLELPKAPKSGAQTGYLTTRALYERCYDIFLERCRAELVAPTTTDDATWDAYVDQESRIERECGLSDAARKLAKAERILFDWAHKRVQEEDAYKRFNKNREAIDQMFAARVLSPSLKDRLISLCLKIGG